MKVPYVLYAKSDLNTAWPPKSMKLHTCLVMSCVFFNFRRDVHMHKPDLVLINWKLKEYSLK